MNRHFQRLAEIVGRALAERWMRRTSGEGVAGQHAAAAKPDPALAPAPRLRRIHHRQHR